MNHVELGKSVTHVSGTICCLYIGSAHQPPSLGDSYLLRFQDSLSEDRFANYWLFQFRSIHGYNSHEEGAAKCAV